MTDNVKYVLFSWSGTRLSDFIQLTRTAGPTGNGPALPSWRSQTFSPFCSGSVRSDLRSEKLTLTNRLKLFVLIGNSVNKRGQFQTFERDSRFKSFLFEGDDQLIGIRYFVMGGVYVRVLSKVTTKGAQV